MTPDTPTDDEQRTPTDAAGGDGYPTDVLVGPDWVEARLDRFRADAPDLRLLEVDVNASFYEEGHAPGAVGVGWRTDLRSAEAHDILSPAEMTAFLESCGITEETTVVIYGDNRNWFAAHLYWQLAHYGHPDVRIMDGGREYWVEHGYPTTTEPVDPPAVTYGDAPDAPAKPEVRADRTEVRAAIGGDTEFVDVRLPEEFRGEVTKPPGSDEGAMRGGHVPGATNVFWAENVRPSGLFRPPAELADVYESRGITPDDDVIVYCRIGERSSLAWFVLEELLGYDHVRHYDGSWTEWGNMIGVPIEVGEADGGG
ncbi:thiosulfate sulfurtransferase [Halorubrum californiense DSM 19288]|uniref:Sulfurtransferase n=1 Tax=Halorubrum californiense DSM 19288 TaxID=1227465 RepID=M0DX75_9EURY|nr:MULTISPECIES: sulfurtransferase [Halorubrum]ELZ40130.1 thiosulfate sulfurtransferase [Halorubrum californiense DSM 19288]TKX73153.1 sulfurtransferase [Halorubrum sp. GN11GM_10-3_MGM]